ncbi:MAG: DUF721 domain-containing protein [Thermoguttaceae bacterium]|nr:DUF721 domain-containing protein [Thermoguttaceae bacterium]
MTDAHRKKGAGRKNSFREANSKERVTPLGYRFIPERRPLGRPSKLSDILPSILARTGMTRRLSVEKFQQCWKTVREQILASRGMILNDDDAVVSGFRGGVLSVTVSSAPLVMELSFCQREILRSFQSEMPDEKIKKIRFVQR